MIRLAKETELEAIVHFIYERNDIKRYYSAYMPKPKAAIHQELSESIVNNQVLITVQEETINGVLVFFISPNNTVDVAGPYVLEDDLDKAKALINACIMHSKQRPLNFFFDDSSDFYKTAMARFDAGFNDREYIMKCYREAFKPHRQIVPITRAQEEEKTDLVELHQRIFKNTYITDDMIADASRYNHLYVYKDETKVVGLSLLIINESHAYIETFGLVPEYRGKGLSKPLLSTLMKRAFSNEGVKYIMLVVDEINTIASALYNALGFVVEHNNVSYTLVPPNTRR